ATGYSPEKMCGSSVAADSIPRSLFAKSPTINKPIRKIREIRVENSLRLRCTRRMRGQEPAARVGRCLEVVQQHTAHHFTAQDGGMCAVISEMGARPENAVGTRVEAISREVRAPGQPGRRGVVVQVAGNGEHLTTSHLPDLRFYQPLDGKARLVGVRLGVDGAVGISGIVAAGEEHLLQIGIAYLQGAHDIAQGG